MENGSCSRAPKWFGFLVFFFRRSTTEHYNLKKKNRGVTNTSKAILKQLKGTAFKFLRCWKAVTKCMWSHGIRSSSQSWDVFYQNPLDYLKIWCKLPFYLQLENILFKFLHPTHSLEYMLLDANSWDLPPFGDYAASQCQIFSPLVHLEPLLHTALIYQAITTTKNQCLLLSRHSAATKHIQEPLLLQRELIKNATLTPQFLYYY